MLYSLRGKLIHKEPGLVVIECGGVGYACRTTYAASGGIGETGREVFLYTYLYVRDENIELFGFSDQQELRCFQLLISISGVGPKAALSILSDLEPTRFMLTVAAGDSKVLTKVKGIGAKTAQRIVLELKDKVAKGFVDGINLEDVGAATAAPAAQGAGQAIAALVSLGYSQSEAALAVSKIDASLPVEEIIKLALRGMAGRR